MKKIFQKKWGHAMRQIKQLLSNIEYDVLQGSVEGEITELVYDSRKAVEGCMFLCMKGSSFDGHQFAAPVADVGARIIIVEQEVDVRSDVTVVMVEDTRAALAEISAAYFDYPVDRLKVIGITGTKGKTTTTYMVKSILENAGYQVGLIGTIESIIGNERIPSANTTPESYTIQEYFAKMVEKGVDICVMEVSSQGLMMHRVDGFEFEIGIFTNIEPDHIGPNEHSSFEDYLHCKALLFQKCRFGIFNADDEHLDEILEDHTCKVLTYGFSKKADYCVEHMQLVHGKGYLGVSYDVTGLVNGPIEIDVPGRFSVYNSLCSIAICNHFQVSLENMQKALKIAKVKGRIELIKVSEEFTLMIDYAHNAMALESLLETLKEYEPGRLVCLFGCGGNRSKLRRYEMGEVAGRLADLTIITSDNPRFEEPADIIADIRTGIEKTDGAFIEIIDRKEAIHYAIAHAKPRDVIVLAGKGHEDYQEIKGKKYPMDERVLIHEVVEELGSALLGAK